MRQTRPTTTGGLRSQRGHVQRLDNGDTVLMEDATEHEHQREFVRWWRQSGRPTIFAIPNGGYRGKNQAGKLKAEGVLAGVLDLFCPANRLWIEFKTPKGMLSPEQKEFAADMTACGYLVMVAYGYADALHQMETGVRFWMDKPNGKA
jgi:hypothetical protein